MSRYASGTTVSVEKSQEQIKSTLRRYGADSFGVMEQRAAATVMFQVNGISIRMTIGLPSRDDPKIKFTPERRNQRSAQQIDEVHDRACKQRWRALLLAIKAKLEAVECGISTIETEFMPFMVMPNGQTFGEYALPRLRRAVESGQMPKMLPLLEAQT